MIQYECTMCWQARTATEMSLPRAIGTSTARKFWTMMPSRRSDIKYSSIKHICKSISSWKVTDVCYLGIIGVPFIAVIALWVINTPALRALWNSAPARKSTHRHAWCVHDTLVRGAEITKPVNEQAWTILQIISLLTCKAWAVGLHFGKALSRISVISESLSIK